MSVTDVTDVTDDPNRERPASCVRKTCMGWARERGGGVADAKREPLAQRRIATRAARGGQAANTTLRLRRLEADLAAEESLN